MTSQASTGNSETVPGLPETMRRFLETLGFGERPDRAFPLTGGVSSDIWFVEARGRKLCIKRALPALRVAAEWRAPVERNHFEYAWFQRVARILPNAVPPLLGHDEQAQMFAMAFLEPGENPLWKRQLLDGKVDPAFAGLVGETLAMIHGATARDPQTASCFSTNASFHAIRLEPYLEATGRAHADLQPQIATLVTQTASTKLTLVHGDISPKNILRGLKGPIYLDAECAWYGDPAFDLAFCLNHLLLKCLPVPLAAKRLASSFEMMVSAYRARINWEDPVQFEARCAALLPGLLLARVDGKSPAEYITTEKDRDYVRAVARPMIASRLPTLIDIRNRWLVRFQ
jgi:aminoglycoside phosphotransferase (APT) family kinase protein